MLRAIDRHKLYEILEQSYFGSANFDVEFGQTDPVVFSITFIPNGDYVFEVMFSGGSFVTTEMPGPHLMRPMSAQCGKLIDVFNHLHAWMARVKEDSLAQSPFAKEMQSLREALDQKLSSLDQETLDEFFTHEEAKALEKRLNELLQRVNELSVERTELAAAVAQLTTTVEELVRAAGEVNRGTWFRMSSSRLLNGMKSFVKSKEVREFALEAAKKLFLEGPGK
jgi:uncharacterized protein YoxC